MASELRGAGLDVRSSWSFRSTAEDNSYHSDGLDRQHSRRNTQVKKRKCRSPYKHVTFVVLVFLILATYGGIIHSYYDGVAKAIEDRFEISHSTSLFVMYVRDGASILTLIFACYFGSRSHPPRVVSLGAFLCGVGIICCGLPHFLWDSALSDLDVGVSNITIATTTEEIALQTDIYGEIRNNMLCSTTGENVHSELHKDAENCPKSSVFISFPQMSRMVLIIVGQILCGIGIGPILPLSVMYLVDATDKSCTSIVVGVFIVALVVGPIAGYFAWQFCLNTPVDFYQLGTADSDLLPSDPEWFGAWWLGFIAGGAFIILVSIPLLCFPRSLQPDAHEDDDGEDDDAYRLIVEKPDKAWEKGCFKGLCFSMRRLFRNVTFTSMVFGLTCEVAIISGFLFLAAKYMFQQFETDLETASVIVVTISLPGVVVGQIIGACVVRRWGLDAKRCARMVFFMCVLSVCCTPLLILIGCRNPTIAGYTIPYPKAIGNASTTIECNANCGCDEHVYDPVCDWNGVIYVSACHAGCRGQLKGNRSLVPGVQNKMIFTACQCIILEGDSNTINPSGGYAFPTCRHKWDCDNKIYLFVGAYVALSLMTSILGNPAFVIIVRCVHQYDRAMAVGMASLVLRTLGFIPAPFYFGAILRIGCWIRDFSCGEEGDCLLYDIERYRYLFIGLFLGLKFLALIAYAVTNRFVRKETDEERYEKIPKANNSESHSEDHMCTDV
ncbi:solute carrier organic anion transporter family member 3A1-like [Anneissia japonica]|uniref:solute carrier organic anion transporter family member 3A1-like n=1 Tax=Anneissia japonica TaxID=1529436 RepID=UPI00142562FE|nr:solute carrier organic anion transporter family member 3A1-like [Anneissia japonica]